MSGAKQILAVHERMWCGLTFFLDFSLFPDIFKGSNLYLSFYNFVLIFLARHQSSRCIYAGIAVQESVQLSECVSYWVFNLSGVNCSWISFLAVVVTRCWKQIVRSEEFSNVYLHFNYSCVTRVDKTFRPQMVIISREIRPFLLPEHRNSLLANNIQI